MKKSKDELGSTYPLIAKSITVDTNNSLIKFELNKNASFHNGSSLTSKDVKFTFDILKKEGHPRYRIYFREIQNIEIIDDYKIVFELENIKNKDLIIQLTQVPILSKNYFKTNDFSKTTVTPIMGSGPYKVTDVSPSQSISYVKNTNYWAKDLPVNQGINNFEKLNINITVIVMLQSEL